MTGWPWPSTGLRPEVSVRKWNTVLSLPASDAKPAKSGPGTFGDHNEPRRRQVNAIGITDKDRHARPQASVEKGSYACRQHRVVEEVADENYIDLRWRR